MISEKPSEAEVRKKIKTRLINRGPRTKQKTMLTALWIGKYQKIILSSHLEIVKDVIKEILYRNLIQTR